MIKAHEDKLNPIIQDAIREAMETYNAAVSGDNATDPTLLQQSIAASLLAIAGRLEWGLAVTQASRA